MDLNLLKKLIKVVEQSEITEFSVQEGDLKVKISKNGSSNMPNAVYSIPQSTMAQPNIPAIESKPEVVESVKTESVEGNNLKEIKSPIVGTFYRAPAPDAEAYVQVGDSITSGTVLCIVEAMKLMNEIESDISGKIVKILVENSTPVEYNQPLFLVQPD